MGGFPAIDLNGEVNIKSSGVIKRDIIAIIAANAKKGAKTIVNGQV